MYISIFIYTLLLLTGSLIGYFKAGSQISLLMGVLSTIFLTLFTLLLYKGHKAAGIPLLTVVLLLDSFFSWRFIQTLKPFPPGIFSLLSTILLIIIALKIQKQKVN
jgi:uncharacterized membrane protein (UPF0136 family)